MSTLIHGEWKRNFSRRLATAEALEYTPPGVMRCRVFSSLDYISRQNRYS